MPLYLSVSLERFIAARFLRVKKKNSFVLAEGREGGTKKKRLRGKKTKNFALSFSPHFSSTLRFSVRGVDDRHFCRLSAPAPASPAPRLVRIEFARHQDDFGHQQRQAACPKPPSSSRARHGEDHFDVNRGGIVSFLPRRKENRTSGGVDVFRNGRRVEGRARPPPVPETGGRADVSPSISG